MGFDIEISGLGPLRRKIRGVEVQAQNVLAQEIARNEIPRIARKMPAVASRYGKLARAAAKTVQTRTIPGGAEIHGGGGNSLGGVVFFGAEFGGQKRRTTYARRSKRGVPHVVSRRRSTMQFHPHLGQRGYWFYPTVRDGLIGMDDRLAKVMDRLIGRG